MCLGIPAKIVKITNSAELLGIAEVGGILREVNLSCITDKEPESLLNNWVLIHVGFALCRLDEQQARETLESLSEMQSMKTSMSESNPSHNAGAD